MKSDSKASERLVRHGLFAFRWLGWLCFIGNSLVKSSVQSNSKPLLCRRFRAATAGSSSALAALPSAEIGHGLR